MYEVIATWGGAKVKGFKANSNSEIKKIIADLQEQLDNDELTIISEGLVIIVDSLFVRKRQIQPEWLEKFFSNKKLTYELEAQLTKTKSAT